MHGLNTLKRINDEARRDATKAKHKRAKETDGHAGLPNTNPATEETRRHRAEVAAKLRAGVPIHMIPAHERKGRTYLNKAGRPVTVYDEVEA